MGINSIDNVSFSGTVRSNNNKTERYSNKYTRSPERDTLELSDTRKRAKIRAERLAKRDKFNQLKGFLLGLSLSAAVAGGVHGVQSINQPKAPVFNAMGYTIEQVADYCDTDERLLKLANPDIDETSVGEIVVPYEFNWMEEQFSEIDEKLKNEKLNDEEKNKLKEERKILLKKEKAQAELGEMYSDGKYAYFLPHEGGVSCEEVKDAWGLKDGVILSNNDIEPNGWTYWEEIERHAKDYTQSTVPYSGIKIPIGEIGKTF